ncbi:MAG TPA: SLC13 family permease [Candidatus Nanopelagicales bacterium]|nr:SLC13 family permease [Candidatus Nanopelagicales bacterium]
MTWVVDDVLRVAPILVFLLSITVVAELADAAGVFESAASLASRQGGGSVLRLWLLLVGLAAACTVLLSLDTTAVLLTPVVLTVARHLGVRPWPFALATVWLANTASLLLPVSNLTNLLLVDQVGWSVATYVGRMWLPAIVAIAVSVGLLLLLLRRSLGGRYEHPDAPVPHDVVLFRTALAVCLLLGPAFVLGVPPWIVGCVAAAVLVVVFAARSRSTLRLGLVPWQLVVTTLALFLVVGLLEQHGLTAWLTTIAGTASDGPVALLRTTFVGAAASNLVNNLPAYVALEPVAASSPDRLLALLVGTNLGPLITLWGSLATLLWRDRCRSGGLDVGASRFALAGAVGVPILLLTTTLALWLTR